MPCIFISWSNKDPLTSLPFRDQILLPRPVELISYISETYPKFAVLQNMKSFYRDIECEGKTVKFIF